MDDHAWTGSTMTQQTRSLLEALIRLGKGALAEFEKWVKAQP